MPDVRPPYPSFASSSFSEVRLSRFLLDESTMLDLPDFLSTRDEDGALLAFPPGSDTVELRVSTLTLSHPDRPTPLAGVEFVVGKASELGVPVHVQGATSWYVTPGPPDTATQLWVAGMGAHVLIASLYTDPATPEDPFANRVVAAISPILTSWQLISAA